MHFVSQIIAVPWREERIHVGCLPFAWEDRSIGPRFRQMVRKTSGLVSFVPESRLPFVQIKSVRFTGKRPRRAETGIKLKAWKKWNANFRLEYSFRKNRTTFSDVPLLPEIFCWNDPKKACSIYFPTGFSRNVCKR